MSEEVICNITPPTSPIFLQTTTPDQDDDSYRESFESILVSRCFDCLGEAKLEKVILHGGSYIENNDIDLFNDVNKEVPKNPNSKLISLFNYNFDLASVFLYNCTDLFRALRNEILYLHNAAKSRHTGIHTLADFHSTEDHFKARQNCIRMFLYLRKYLSCLHAPSYDWIVNGVLPRIEEKLSGFRLFLRRLSDLPEYVLHHSANSQGNKCTEAPYHLFHNQLDMLWLHLSSLYLVDRCRRAAADDVLGSQQFGVNGVCTPAVNLDQNVIALIADLTQLAVLRFEKTDVRSLLIKSPFSCNCVAELWILVSVLTNRLHEKGICDNLWPCFNKVMEQLLSSGGKNKKPNCKSLAQTVTHPCSSPSGFALWLLKNVAMVYAYDGKSGGALPVDNYKLLESIMKGLLSSDVSEAHMRVYLKFVERILIKYWEPDTKPIILLWEYFQRRLNSTFYVPGTSIDSIAVMSQSVAGMVKQIKSRLSATSSCDNSFQMFLRILGLYLQRVSGQNQHWNQIRGRIYSKLSASKVSGLNETGLYHLVALFLTLAVTADLNEVSKKLQSLLASLPVAEGDAGVRRLVWRSHLSVCLLLAERGHDITPTLAPVTSCLGQQLDVSLYRTFLDGLKDILDASPTLKIDYTVLVGAWIPKYLSECSPNDSSRLLETLDLLIVRVQSQPMDHEQFQSSLWQHLGPFVRRRVVEDNPPLQLADICLNLCLPQWATGREVVQLMLTNNNTHISIVRRFLSKLVQNSEVLAVLKAAHPNLTESHEILIIKSWIRCNLLSVDFNSSDLSVVTRYITYLPFISSICMDLPSAADPLVHFIVNVSNKYKAFEDICERSCMRQFMSRVLTGLDKWVEPYVKQSKSQELLGRVYHVTGLVFSLLPTFIYMKSRPNTVLKGLLDVMFLPQCAYKPNYDPQFKSVIASDIHHYITGLAELSKMQDMYVDRCIQDLIRIYLPLVSVYNHCKLHECIQRADNSVKLILITVCSVFLKKKTSSPHPHCTQALRFLKSVVKLYSRNNDVMLLLVNTILEHVSDVTMFCDEHNQAKHVAREVIFCILESDCFSDELGVQVILKFDNLCREYLPFTPKNVFGLITEVSKHRPELISRFLPNLHSHVKTVELKRGFGYDNSLRSYLLDLENKLKNMR